MPEANADISVETSNYRLTIPADRPYAWLDTSAGRVAELFLLSTADSTRGADATTATGEWTVSELRGETVLTLVAGSTVWDRRQYTIRCRQDGIEYAVTVEGNGGLTDATYFGGYSGAHPRWGAGLFHSGHRFTQGFSPEPDAAGTVTFDPRGEATIDLGGGPLPGRRHWFFTPAPFFYAFASGTEWLGLGLEANPGSFRFTEYRYRGGDGFRLTVPFDGRTEVSGSYALPAINMLFAGSAYDGLREHVNGLHRRGSVPAPSRPSARWWSEPLFCGWGAQCRDAAAAAGYRPAGKADASRFIRTLGESAEYSSQENYVRWIGTLAANKLHPQTVVIDDKWQKTYGENEADEGKWPDLSGFIRKRHAHGERVLLWLKAWDREGVPDEECIRTRAGIALSVDPSHPGFERRMRGSVRRMLSPNGYDADGFKIDFTHRIPSGPGLVTHGDAWGLELMRLYLAVIHEEAVKVKPDALIVAHAPHPYLSDVVDMVRLNDTLDLSLSDWEEIDVVESMRRRAEIVRICRPEALIDTDNWPVPDRRTWRRYVRAQPEMGVPALYFASGIDLSQEAFGPADYRLIRETWEWYRRL